MSLINETLNKLEENKRKKDADSQKKALSGVSPVIRRQKERLFWDKGMPSPFKKLSKATMGVEYPWIIVGKRFLQPGDTFLHWTGGWWPR